jgi:hypothetical protein
VGEVLHGYLLMSNPDANVGMRVLRLYNTLKTKQFLFFLVWNFENRVRKLRKKEEKVGEKVVIHFHSFHEHEGGGSVSALENEVFRQEFLAY